MPSAEEVVHDLLPLHGPYGRDHTVRAGYLIDELLRYLNYATAYPQALPYPATISDLIGLLKTAADKIPQVLQQSGQRLAAIAADPALINHGVDHAVGHDAAHDDAVAITGDALDQLRHARDSARVLARHLATAQNLLSPLGLTSTIADDDQLSPPDSR